MSSEGASCPACGTPLKPGARFCGACGGDTTSSGIDLTPDVAAPPDAQPPACGRCGRTLKPEARFCPGCGTPFETAAAPRASSQDGRRGPMLVMGVSLLVLVVAAGALAMIAWGRWGPRPGDAPPAVAAAPRPSPPRDAAPAPAASSPTTEAAPIKTDADRVLTADSTATDAAATAERETRRSRRSTAPARAPTRTTPSAREAAPPSSAPPPAADVLCIRPDGSETRTSRANCRAQGGVIY